MCSLRSSKRHYGDADGLRLLSYNAIFNAVLSNRNYGKTWLFKKRAFKRAMKRGHKTIWIRLFDKEVKECSATFFSSVDLQKYCGVSIYDKKSNPNGNLKQNGRTFYYRPTPKSPWRWFLKIFKLGDADAVRSADDVKTDTIVFDEFTKAPHLYRRFAGNITESLIDILFSSKREHEVKVIFLGNKESYNNPVFSYFGIKPLPVSYEGIRTYRGGSFAVQQINNVDEGRSEYDRKMQALLKGTAYGDYIFKSSYRTARGLKPRKTPSSASLYAQVVFNSIPLKISVCDGFYYVNDRIDINKRFYCDLLPHKYKHEYLLVKRQKVFFTAFINALADNRVYFDSEATYEALLPFLQWLSI